MISLSLSLSLSFSLSFSLLHRPLSMPLTVAYRGESAYDVAFARGHGAACLLLRFDPRTCNLAFLAAQVRWVGFRRLGLR
jgi:hypothetical protein